MHKSMKNACFVFLQSSTWFYIDGETKTPVPSAAPHSICNDPLHRKCIQSSSKAQNCTWLW